MLLTVDALRPDHLGCYGYSRNTTPVIDSVAETAHRFTEAYSVSCHTREAVPSLLTGKLPDKILHRHYRLNTETLSSQLQEEGYTTAGFCVAPFLTAANGYTRGFDHFWTSYRHSKSNLLHLLEYGWEIATNTHYTDGATVTDQLISFLELRESPQFAWVHYMDVHGPYNRYNTTHYGEEVSPRTIQRLFRRAKYRPETVTADERQMLIDAYDNSLRQLDTYLTRLWEWLTETDQWQDTIVILTADHGEAFGENGRYEHLRYLDDELLRVPLLVWTPFQEAQDVSKKVASIDIAATVAEYAGLDTFYFQGRSLFDRIHRPVKSTCLTRWKRKYRVI